ncbi:MAG: CZB domain-containing protein [Sulfurimonadaceae bacterium]|nr:CZB domain-containing protein [Sulfurimonadaceae bacterium]
MRGDNVSAKELYLNHLREARAKHLHWLKRVKQLVSGMRMASDAIELKASQSRFGIWFYDEAAIYTTAENREVMQAIESLHAECFDYYAKIHRVMFNRSSGSFFGMIMGYHKAGAKELAAAQEYYEVLVDVSDEMIKKLRKLEKQMAELSENRFEELALSEALPNDQIDLVGVPSFTMQGHSRSRVS